MSVVVTGGSGFVGRRLQLIRPEWIYLSSGDVDLLNFEEIYNYLDRNKPSAVVHLAARVGGIKDNADHPSDFFSQNCRMNTNVLEACRKAGIPRLLSSLSTCAFPDVVESYPFDESVIHDGAPAETNLSYGYSKRLLFVHTNAIRKQYGLNYSCFSPSNLYGPEDNFDLDSSHFVAAAIRKLHESKGTVEFWGTGKPKRQQLYVDDLCKAIPLLLNSHHGDEPIIVAPDENLSISDLVGVAKTIIRPGAEVVYNGKLDGQYRKDGSNKLFKSLFPAFSFTSIEKGIKETYEWYKASVHNRY